MKNEKRPEGLPTEPTKPDLKDELLASARDMAAWGQLRKMHPQFTVEMHDQIIARLIELDCMWPAWKEMAAAAKRPNQRPGGIAYGFLSTCIDAFMVYKLVEVRPDASHRKHYGNLAATVRKVMTAIETDLELSTWASTVMAPHTGLVDDMINFATRTGLSVKDAEHIGMAGRHYAAYRAPKLLDVLGELATHTELLADAGPLSTRPNKHDSHEIYFVRRVSEWLKEEFGAPLHAVTACASNALFASDMDAERVQRLANKNW